MIETLTFTPPRTGPTIKRGRSRQDYATPREFIDAVEKRFGKIDIDLAASADNAVGGQFIAKERDSLADDCAWYPGRPLCWLNPEFSNITPWARKCAIQSANGARILFLTPASVGSEWFREFVEPNAVTLFLNPRLCFDGVAPYPRDCQLSVFWGGLRGAQSWRWK